MKTNEAIEAIKSNYPDERYSILREALDMAISALEKQIPKEPIIVHPLQENDGGEFACPICKTGPLVKSMDKFCWNCGQAIKFE